MLRSGFRTVLLAAAMLLVPLAGSGAASAARVPADPQPAPYAAQASRLGLTHAEAGHLQVKVDREVRRTGGTQVAANEVHWRGGNTVFVLPGETHARHLTAGAAARASGTLYRCLKNFLCLYHDYWYQGTMHELLHCTYYRTGYQILSYVNNQSANAAAPRLYDSHGKYFTSLPRAASRANIHDYGLRTWSVKPC